MVDFLEDPGRSVKGLADEQSFRALFEFNVLQLASPEGTLQQIIPYRDISRISHPGFSPANSHCQFTDTARCPVKVQFKISGSQQPTRIQFFQRE
ncbi:MAG: hypothetical protein EOM66_10845 [Clostridia bacterium]|nr:hypothetical protein [Clostridia bacterium]